MRLLPRSATKRRPFESNASECGISNCPGPDPCSPHALMNFPFLSNFITRAGPVCSLCPLPCSSSICQERFQIGCFAELLRRRRRIDCAHESGQHAAGSDFNKSRYAGGGKQAHAFCPSNGIGNLLIEPLAGFRARSNLASGEVVDERGRKIAEGGRV